MSSRLGFACIALLVAVLGCEPAKEGAIKDGPAAGDPPPPKLYTCRLKAQPGPVEFQVMGGIEADLSGIPGVPPEQTKGSGKLGGRMVVELTEAEGGNLHSKVTTADMTVTEGTGMLAGQEALFAQQMAQDKPEESILTPLGERISGGEQGLSTPFLLPEQPVKVGDKFEIKQKSGKHAEGKVVGIDRTSGREMLQIEVIGVDHEIPQGEIVGPIQILFDPEAGLFAGLGVDMRFRDPNGMTMLVKFDLKRTGP